MSEDRRIIACHRSDASPELATKNGCVERFCAKCARGVWVAPSTFRFMARQPAVKWEILCNACTTPEVENAEGDALFISPNPNALVKFLRGLRSK